VSSKSVNLPLNEQQSRQTLSQKDKVRQNREILKRLIHIIVLLCKQILAFRGHDEGKELANKGNMTAP
jgi:hypothetical protein